MDFFANSLANLNAVRFGFATRNTYGVCAGLCFANGLPRFAANGLGSRFATELSNAASFGAGFATVLSNAAVFGSCFATELSNAAFFGSRFATPFSNAASFGACFRLANRYTVGVRLLFATELGNAYWNFAALDFWNPYFSAYGSVARSTSARIAIATV